MVYGHQMYQISFLKSSEEEHFAKTLLFNIMFFAGIVLFLSWLASIFIARYLTRPLVKIEQQVKRIANRDWHEPLDVTQNDEIGQLALSIEIMRRRLVRQDELQKSMLQNISHELKTPVMVIRSYAQGIQDGVFPKGDLSNSIKVIDEEGARLEKLVKQLLYLTHLDYLSTRNQRQEKIRLDRLAENVVQRLYIQRPEISWKLDLQPTTINGNEEIFQVMIENILENHLRYATSQIQINLQTAKDKKPEVIFSVWNDGSSIEPHIAKELFQPFQKGKKGKYGLGLTIVQRIVKMYNGQIELRNERSGVSTTVRLPLKDK